MGLTKHLRWIVLFVTTTSLTSAQSADTAAASSSSSSDSGFKLSLPAIVLAIIVGILFVIFVIVASHVYVETKKRRAQEAYRRAARVKVDKAVRAAKTTATLLQKDQYFTDLHRKQLQLTGTMNKDSTTNGVPHPANAKLATQARSYITVEGQQRGTVQPNTANRARPVRDNSRLQEFFVVDEGTMRGGNTLPQQPRQKGTQSFYVPGGSSTVLSRPGYAHMQNLTVANRGKANAPLPKLPEMSTSQYGGQPGMAHGDGRQLGTMTMARGVHFNLPSDSGHYGRVPSKNPNSSAAVPQIHYLNEDGEETVPRHTSHYGHSTRPAALPIERDLTDPLETERNATSESDAVRYDEQTPHTSDRDLTDTDEPSEAMRGGLSMTLASSDHSYAELSRGGQRASQLLMESSDDVDGGESSTPFIPRVSLLASAQEDHKFRPWFHGTLTRQEAEALMRAEGLRDGLFLVRSSNKGARQYALSVCSGGVIFHNLIEGSEDGFTNSYGFTYPSLAALVERYRTPCPEVQLPLTDHVKSTVARSA